MNLLVPLLFTIATACATERPPNTVFILADDLGITDITPISPPCGPATNSFNGSGLSFHRQHQRFAQARVVWNNPFRTPYHSHIP